METKAANDSFAGYQTIPGSSVQYRAVLCILFAGNQM